MYQHSRIEAARSAPAPRFARASAAPAFGARSAAAAPAARFSLVVDLSRDLGSPHWLRGAATLALLCSAAWWATPGFEPLPGASPASFSEAQWHEAEASAVAPLAYGAETGRRMVQTSAVELLLDAPERPTVELLVSIDSGDGLASALERAGVSSTDAARAAQLIASAVPLDGLRPGTPLAVTLGSRPNRGVPRPLVALSLRPCLDLRLSVARTPLGLALAASAVAVDAAPLRLQGMVGDSLYASARAAGLSPRAVQDYIRALATQDGLDSLSASDRFDVVVEHRRAATGEAEEGRLLYAGLIRGEGVSLQLMPWTVGGRTQWFEASGVGKASGILQRPVPGGVSSSFGMRFHPILGIFRMHKGMDFHAASGTPILAVTDGQVVGAGWAGGYGNQVRLAHGGGLMTSYSHMSRIAAAPGAFVRQGEVIGYVGSTGLSTGPHLHYEITRNGVPVNPAAVQFAGRSQISGSELAAFRQRLYVLLSLQVGARPRA